MGFAYAACPRDGDGEGWEIGEIIHSARYGIHLRSQRSGEVGWSPELPVHFPRGLELAHGITDSCDILWAMSGDLDVLVRLVLRTACCPRERR